jgi:ribonuclease P protein component
MPRRLGRLFDRQDFLRIAAARRKWVTPGLILQAVPNPTPAAAGAHAEGRRLGITASKKVGNSVARNRAKRRLRALARDMMAEDAVADRDYVLIARAETVGRSYQALKADMATALHRLGVKRVPDKTS